MIIHLTSHFVTCSKAVYSSEVIEARKALIKKLRTLNTYDGLVDLLSVLLKGLPTQGCMYPISPNFLAVWSQAMSMQEGLGWNCFIQGYWHIQWKEVQDMHIRARKESYQFDQWITSVLHALLTYLYDCWKIRNKAIHNPNEDEDRTHMLHHRVRALYLDPDRFLYSTREKRRLFSAPLQKKLKQSNASLESWIDLVEARLRLDREEHARRTLTRWLEKDKHEKEDANQS